MIVVKRISNATLVVMEKLLLLIDSNLNCHMSLSFFLGYYGIIAPVYHFHFNASLHL